MDKINDGGPAFPVMAFDSADNCHAYEGMTLRDYFAAKALQPLLVGKEEHENARIAARVRAAYMYADAMLAARGKA